MEELEITLQEIEINFLSLSFSIIVSTKIEITIQFSKYWNSDMYVFLGIVLIVNSKLFGK